MKKTLWTVKNTEIQPPYSILGSLEDCIKIMRYYSDMLLDFHPNIEFELVSCEDYPMCVVFDEHEYDNYKIELSIQHLNNYTVPKYKYYCIHELLHIQLRPLTRMAAALTNAEGLLVELRAREETFVKRLAEVLAVKLGPLPRKSEAWLDTWDILDSESTKMVNVT